MIRPARAFSIGRVTALMAWKAPDRFVSMTDCHASSDIRMIRSSRVMPALLTRMSTLPNASSAALTTRSPASGWLWSAWIARALRPSASDRGRGLVGSRRVAAEAERHVRALGREAEGDRPSDPARAAGDERGLALEVDHAWTSRAGSGSPGTTSSSGMFSGSGRAIDLGERVRDGIDGIPVLGQANVHGRRIHGRVSGDAARRDPRSTGSSRHPR